jgi:putative colanic acid biosynthesis UDP-glucose lipid carrier transferase
MSSNNQSNRLIKWIVIFGDFFLLNVILLAFRYWLPEVSQWGRWTFKVFLLVSNIALMLAQLRFSTIIHLRLVGAGDILQRILGLASAQMVIAYIMLKILVYERIGVILLAIASLFVFLLTVKRMVERWFIRLYREAGRNMRTVTLVGSDSEVMTVFDKLRTDPTLGYSVLGYYGDKGLKPEDRSMETEGKGKMKKKREPELEWLGSMEEFVKGMDDPESLVLGDELYLCVSRTKRGLVRKVSNFCDHLVIRFYYVPISVESLGLNLKSELLDDMEIFTTYENPLQNSVNRAEKRAFDLLLVMVFLIPTLLVFPFVVLIMKIQSPGPIFFKQKRTGLDGKDFYLYKFRSMHVNADADKVQATKNDPRKYPFGNFMRKSNLDEVPQIFNILKGDMSVVGPRPHMLAHTEQYSKLIDKYMVRHFVKPGVTGWAQVTGFRGETNELWQMEGRVKRDIWYMEHWSIWLDIRIIWMTLKTFFVHDKNAY